MQRRFGLVLGLLQSAAVNGANPCLDPTNVNNKCILEAGATINLSGCGITHDDEDDLLACMDSAGRSSISTLFIADNPKLKIPSGLFTGMTSLQELHLNDSGLMLIPDYTFDNLSSLQRLYLNNNSLFPPERGVFKGLSGLKYLSLSGNSMTGRLAEGLFEHNGSLETLLLDDNNLRFLPAGIFDKLRTLKHLDLSKNDLTLQNGVFDELVVLEELYLGDNANLLCVPSTRSPFLTVQGNPAGLVDGGSCACPETGYTGYCGAECEPGVDGYMCSSKSYCLDLEDPLNGCSAGLFTVGLSGCGITDDDLGALGACLDNIGRANIATIYLHNNRLTYLPDDILAGLGKLTTLNLSGNQLTTLPVDIFKQCYLMRSLQLNDNDLVYLPAGVFDSRNELTYLELQSNDLTTLPAGLFDDLEKINDLDLGGNDDLQCVPSLAGSRYFYAPTGLKLPTGVDSTTSSCACPGAGEDGACPGGCQPGVDGYLCVEATPAPIVFATPAPSAAYACPLELLACADDAGCLFCMDGDAIYDACLVGFPLGANDDACDVYATAACCITQIPGYENCLKITEFVDYVTCYAGHENGGECLDDFLSSCSDGTPSPAIANSPSPREATTPAPSTTPAMTPSPTPSPSTTPAMTPSPTSPPTTPSPTSPPTTIPTDAPLPTAGTPTQPPTIPRTPSPEASQPTVAPANKEDPALPPSPKETEESLDDARTPGPTPQGPVCYNDVPGIQVPGIQVGDVCCHPDCSQCGGSNCSSSGAAKGLGGNDCCINKILDSGNKCGEAPCILEACSSEARACEDQEECSECLSVEGGGKQTEWNACFQRFAVDSDDLCTTHTASACCLAQISSNDCLENDEFVEYYKCVAERETEEECPDLSEVSCGPATVAGGVGSDGSGAGQRFGMNSINRGVCTFAAGIISVLAATFY